MLIIKESLKLSRRLNCVCGWLEWLFDVKVNDWIIQREWFPNDNFTFPITDFDLLQQHPIAWREPGVALGSAAAFPSPSGTWSRNPPLPGDPSLVWGLEFFKGKGRENICFKQNGLLLYQYDGLLLGCVSGCGQALGNHLDADLGIVVLALHRTWKCTWLCRTVSGEACCLLSSFMFSPSPSSRFAEFIWSLLPSPSLFFSANQAVNLLWGGSFPGCAVLSVPEHARSAAGTSWDIWGVSAF